MFELKWQIHNIVFSVFWNYVQNWKELTTDWILSYQDVQINKQFNEFIYIKSLNSEVLSSRENTGDFINKRH